MPVNSPPSGNWGHPCPNLVKNLKVVGTILITINFEQKSVCQLFKKKIQDKDGWRYNAFCFLIRSHLTITHDEGSGRYSIPAL